MITQSNKNGPEAIDAAQDAMKQDLKSIAPLCKGPAEKSTTSSDDQAGVEKLLKSRVIELFKAVLRESPFQEEKFTASHLPHTFAEILRRYPEHGDMRSMVFLANEKMIALARKHEADQATHTSKPMWDAHAICLKHHRNIHNDFPKVTPDEAESSTAKEPAASGSHNLSKEREEKAQRTAEKYFAGILWASKKLKLPYETPSAFEAAVANCLTALDNDDAFIVKCVEGSMGSIKAIETKVPSPRSPVRRSKL